MKLSRYKFLTVNEILSLVQGSWRTQNSLLECACVSEKSSSRISFSSPLDKMLFYCKITQLSTCNVTVILAIGMYILVERETTRLSWAFTQEDIARVMARVNFEPLDPSRAQCTHYYATTPLILIVSFWLILKLMTEIIRLVGIFIWTKFCSHNRAFNENARVVHLGQMYLALNWPGYGKTNDGWCMPKIST